MRIVQIANFYGAASGGLRTTMNALARGYMAAGHESVLITPGHQFSNVEGDLGRTIQLPSRRIPRSGGYRAITDIDLLCTVLDEIEPDIIEVADRLTLRPMGWWARDRGVPAVMWAHERIDGVLRAFTPPLWPRRVVADTWNRATYPRFDRVVATTAYAAEEFRRIGAANVELVPLGVDLETFHPDRRDEALRADVLGPGCDVLIATASRLSREKRPDLAVEMLRTLRRRGVKARLLMMGGGPLEAGLRRTARHLPITVMGHVGDRELFAAALASADVVVAPGPIETFGLAALEALASGTPVVASRTSALPEIVTGAAGQTVTPEPSSMALAVMAQLRRPSVGRRRAARERAEDFPWSRTVDRMIALHGELMGAPAR